MLEEFFEDGEGEDVGAFNVEMIRSGEILKATDKSDRRNWRPSIHLNN